MTTKHYLPSPVLSFDIEELKDHIIPTIERNTPSHVKIPRCARRFLPIFSIFALLFGSAFLGFSFIIVNEGNIGYYSSSKDVQIFEPGTYFALPWSKGTFNIVDVTDRNITIGTIPGLESNGTCLALQHVKNVTEYVTSLVLFSDTTRLLTEVVALLKKELKVSSFANFTYTIYGLSFTNPFFV